MADWPLTPEIPTRETGGGWGGWGCSLRFLSSWAGFLYLRPGPRREGGRAPSARPGRLGPGDRVHTSSGLEATVVAITDDTVDLEIAPGVVTTWMKLAVRDRILPDDEVELDEDEDAEELAESDEPGDSTDSPNGSRAIR